MAAENKRLAGLKEQQNEAIKQLQVGRALDGSKGCWFEAGAVDQPAICAAAATALLHVGVRFTASRAEPVTRSALCTFWTAAPSLLQHACMPSTKTQPTDLCWAQNTP